MKIKAVIILILAAVACVISAGGAGAENPDRFPGLPPTAIEKEIQNTGVLRWRYEQRTCGGYIRPAIEQALRRYEEVTGVLPVYDAYGPRHLSTCGVEFAAFCGANPSVIGCLGEGFPYNVNIAYRGDSMVTFQPQSQVAIALHEIGHACCGWNEQYGAGLVCLPIPDFMSCGAGAAKDFTPATVDRFRRTMAPEPVQYPGELRYHPDGTPFIFFCDFDGMPRTTHVALMARSPDGVMYWTGLHYAPATPSDPCRGQVLDPAPGWCFFWNAENAFSWKVAAMRNDYLSTCT